MKNKRFIYLAKLGIIETTNKDDEYDIQRIDSPKDFQVDNELSFEPPLLESDDEATAIFQSITMSQLMRINGDNLD